MTHLLLLALLVAQLPPELQLSAEESIDNLARCDNFYCEFELTKARLRQSSVEDIDLSTLDKLATCRVRWWKSGDSAKYVMDNIENRDKGRDVGNGLVILNGWTEQQVLSGGNYALVTTGSRIGQVFSQEHRFPGPQITPLNLGLLGPDLKLAPGYVIRGAGKFLKLDQIEIGDDAVSFRSESIERPDLAASMHYTLDPSHAMSPRRVGISAPHLEGIAQVAEFAQINGAWFPSLVTYSQKDPQLENTGQAIIIKVVKLEPFHEGDSLAVTLNKGTVLNDDTEDHLQITLDRDREVRVSDLAQLHGEVSAPDDADAINERKPTARTLTRLILGVVACIGLYYGISLIRKRK